MALVRGRVELLRDRRGRAVGGGASAVKSSTSAQCLRSVVSPLHSLRFAFMLCFHLVSFKYFASRL